MATATCSSLELLLLLLWRRRQEKLSVLNGTHISQSVLSHISVLTVESSQAAEHPKAWTPGLNQAQHKLSMWELPVQGGTDWLGLVLCKKNLQFSLLPAGGRWQSHC